MKINQLKELGHKLLDEYIELTAENRVYLRPKREVAYEKLQERMKGKNPHFGSMKTKKEVMLAIGTLKKMIVERKLGK